MSMTRTNALRAFAWLAAVGGVAVSVGAMWTVDYLPIQDGPAHVWLTEAWRTLPEQATLQSFASENLTLAPNWTATLLLRLLTGWLSPETAQTALVSLLVFSFVLAMAYALSPMGKGGGLLTVLGAVLSLHWYLYRGSFNYCLGVVAFAVTIGFWLRQASRPSGLSAATLSVLLVLTYLSHPVPFIAAVVVVAILVFGQAAERRGEPGADTKGILLLPALASLPSLGLLTTFLARSGSGALDVSVSFGNPVEWIGSRVTLRTILESLDPSERPWILLFAGSLLVAVCSALFARVKSRQWEWTDGLLVAGLLLTGGAYVAPVSGLGGTQIPDRIVLCAVITIVIWTATIRLQDWIVAAVISLGLIATLGLTLNRLDSYERYDEQQAEIVATGASVERDAAILSVSLWRYLEPPFHRVMPPLYAGSWIATDRAGIDLGNLDLGTDYHPLRWRDDLDQNLFDWMARYGTGDLEPSRPDGPPPERGTIDYVLLLGPLTEDRMDLAFSLWLTDEYTLIASSPNGIAHLYRSVAGTR